MYRIKFRNRIYVNDVRELILPIGESAQIQFVSSSIQPFYPPLVVSSDEKVLKVKRLPPGFPTTVVIQLEPVSKGASTVVIVDHNEGYKTIGVQVIAGKAVKLNINIGRIEPK